MPPRSPLLNELNAKIIQLLLSGLPLGEVEAWIYGNKELEANLDDADYLALISLDFRHASSWVVIEKTLSRYIGRAALAAEKRRDLDRLAACYLRYQRARRDQDFWAVDMFFHTESREEKWAFGRPFFVPLESILVPLRLPPRPTLLNSKLNVGFVTSQPVIQSLVDFVEVQPPLGSSFSTRW